MSSNYTTEPQPTGKVVLHTTSGDLVIELFAKQAPLASRNFLQHCLDDYYRDTAFFRLIRGFIIQGGDPTNTGAGGQSSFEPDGAPFADEFHSRLRFGRRGMVGMAGGGSTVAGTETETEPQAENGSQFFVTLGKADELNGKHTLFGRVVGESIYTLVRMGEAELAAAAHEAERPLYPTVITGADVLLNPFEGMVRRERRRVLGSGPTAAAAAADGEQGRLKRKKKKGAAGKKTLLSFVDADEEEEGEDLKAGPVPGAAMEAQADEMMSPPVKKKPKFNPKLIMADPEPEPDRERKPSPSTKKAAARADPLSTFSSSTTQGITPAQKAAANVDAAQAPQVPQVPQRPPPSSPARPGTIRPRSPSSDSASSGSPSARRAPTALEATQAEIAAVKASMKRTGMTAKAGVPSSSSSSSKRLSALEQLIPATSIRGRKRPPKAGGPTTETGREHEREAIRMLDAFRAKLVEADLAAVAAAAATAANKKMTVNGGDDQHPPDPEPDTTNHHDGGDNDNDDSEAQLCDLHFIADCLSCRAWAAPTTSHDDTKHDHDKNVHVDVDNDDTWLAHTLTFAKDRLGKDLRWRQQNEADGLVVIDPREKQREMAILDADGRGGRGRRRAAEGVEWRGGGGGGGGRGRGGRGG
ncbi:MAG: Peptidyl-prolyl isomerase cwc27 [Phylliscum demangeonii]|nr:MAG: Peptidyl-prolyl isomerase cwc27 [Phylliscum demangeonii]